MAVVFIFVCVCFFLTLKNDLGKEKIAESCQMVCLT